MSIGLIENVNIALFKKQTPPLAIYKRNMCWCELGAVLLFWAVSETRYSVFIPIKAMKAVTDTLNQKSQFPSDTFWYNSRNV